MRTPAILALTLGTAATALALPAPQPTFTSAAILGDAKLAFDYATKKITTSPGCGWTRGTYMLGLWDYYNASSDPNAKSFLVDWGKHYEYKLCGPKEGEEELAAEHDGSSRRQLQVGLPGPCSIGRLDGSYGTDWGAGSVRRRQASLQRGP